MNTARKNIFLIIAALAIAGLLFQGCEKDFDEINKDPDAITEVPPDYLLPGSIMSISNIENGYMESFAYASDWVQFTASALWPDPGRYYFEKSRSFMWDNMLTGPLQDLKVMNKLSAEAKNNSLRAVSAIMYAYGFGLLTDAYGPVPYEQSLQAENGINKPAYDGQEVIYLALLDTLETANALLNGVSKIDIKADYDVMFSADALKWQKFCNGLRLRMLMRISMVKDVKAELQALVSDNNNPLPEGNDDNAKFDYPGTTPVNYFPLYDILSEDATDAGYRVSQTLVDQLQATEDPRLTIYAMPNENGEYVGLENGMATSTGEIDTYSRVNTHYGRKTRAGVFLTYSEVQFLLAEAAARQLIAGDPEDYYNEAVRANFLDLGFSEDDYESFILSGGGYAGLDRVLVQKWVSLFGRGFEAWTEYRRTGVPELTPAANAFVEVVPMRFLYPITEEQTNNANLQQAIETLNNGDALDSKLWWMN
ncbi:MAG: SusD/RagB family nutrient-binding outer membrane lipoprotein [Bacteroidales bacterium]